MKNPMMMILKIDLTSSTSERLEKILPKPLIGLRLSSLGSSFSVETTSPTCNKLIPSPTSMMANITGNAVFANRIIIPMNSSDIDSVDVDW